MLDIFHLASQPGVDIQTFYGLSPTTLLTWQIWRKPRGVKFIYAIAIGGGASGGCGLNSSTTSGGGSGGSSGAQSSVLIPATFLPDTLYIQTGTGGAQPSVLVSAAVSVVGQITYVSVEPSQAAILPNCTLLFASGGPVGTAAATSTVGGTATGAAAVATIANMPLAGRGIYSFFVGLAGTAGGSSTTAGVNRALPTTGLIVCGGAGGGGNNAGTSNFAGGNITGVGLGAIFPSSNGGAAASGATPAGAGGLVVSPNYMMNYGGSGGGGSSNTSGGVAGAGGNAAAGSGGGGAGGSNSTITSLARPGDGGPGFVIIISF